MERVVGGGGGGWRGGGCGWRGWWVVGVVDGRGGVNEQSSTLCAGLCLGQTSHPEPWFY